LHDDDDDDDDDVLIDDDDDDVVSCHTSLAFIIGWPGCSLSCLSIWEMECSGTSSHEES